MNPSVTVITPTLSGREGLLRECKQSVWSQTVPVTHLVAEDTQGEGPGVVRNRLAERADSEWLLPLDDDDLLDPDAVEVLLGSAGPDTDVVYPWCRVLGKDDWCPNRLFNADALLRYNYIPVTALIRRSLFDRVGGYRTIAAEDWNLWLRMLGAGALFKCVPEVLWSYRILASGESRNQWAA